MPEESQDNKIDADYFKKIYYEKTDPEIASILGVKSVITVRRYAERLGLKLKGMGYMYPNDKRQQLKSNIFNN